MSTLAAFFALAGGASVRRRAGRDRHRKRLDHTLDVRDDTKGFGGLFAQDLAAGSVRASEVQDGGLKDEDVARARRPA